MPSFQIMTPNSERFCANFVFAYIRDNFAIFRDICLLILHLPPEIQIHSSMLSVNGYLAP